MIRLARDDGGVGIENLPTEQRRRDAAATLGELLARFGIETPAGWDPSEPPGHFVYVVVPPGVDGVCKVGMGTADRVRRWTSHGWTLVGQWRTGDPEQSRELERVALDLLTQAGAMDTVRLRKLRRGFSSFDGVTEWFDSTVARVTFAVDGGEWSVMVEAAEVGS